MLRLFQLIAILIPLGIYLAYVFAKRRQAAAMGHPLPSWWQQGPGFWAILGGLSLLIAGLAVFSAFDGAPAGSRYVAPRMVDGHLVEGQMIDPAGPRGGEPTAPDTLHE
ncbi:MAG: hypothetical protein H6843_00785 [Rhodospirillaceae bacterium]|nr:hypothetical protein [Rhodospirillaceae bacterium]